MQFVIVSIWFPFENIKTLTSVTTLKDFKNANNENFYILNPEQF